MTRTQHSSRQNAYTVPNGSTSFLETLSGRQDLNLRPTAPKAVVLCKIGTFESFRLYPQDSLKRSTVQGFEACREPESRVYLSKVFDLQVLPICFPRIYTSIKQ